MSQSKKHDRAKQIWAEIKGYEQQYLRLCEEAEGIEQEKRDVSFLVQKKLKELDAFYESLNIPQNTVIDFREHFDEGMPDLVKMAKNYAIRCHAETNHLYDGWPYSLHLEMVYQYGLKYKHLVNNKEIDEVLAACWVHDVIEDARQTYNDVKKVTNERVADIAYVLTNNKGKSREDRANLDYYHSIYLTAYAGFVKICDRLANMKYSKEKGSRMFEVYKQEHARFFAHLYSPQYSEMFKEMEELLEIKK